MQEYLRESIDSVKLFGKDRAQEDENLMHYFVKTNKYDEIASGARELVLGRKGAGKSALFRALSEGCKDEIPVQISFDGEDFIYIQNALKTNNICELVNDEFKYSLAWKDFIISEIVLATLRHAEKLDNDLSAFLAKNGLTTETTWKKFAKSLIKVIKGVQLQENVGKIELDFSGLAELLEPDKIKINEAINKLIQQNRFFVLIDNLDEPWKNTTDMNSWLLGLIYAIRQLKREFRNLKIVAFLRTDIYDIISRNTDLFDSKSEITSLTWDDNNYYNLKLLVACRIAYYFNKEMPTTQEDIQVLWDIVFPHAITYGKHHPNLSDYMINRTFLRPRELLQFCRQILAEGKAKFLPVEQNAISPAEIQYSQWKLNDVTGEYSKSYANIDKCIETFIGAKRTWDWPVLDLIKHLDGIEQSARIINCATRETLSSKEAVEVLYRICFLRKVDKKPMRRTKYKLQFQDAVINYEFSLFDIHPAFRKKFVQY